MGGSGEEGESLAPSFEDDQGGSKEAVEAFFEDRIGVAGQWEWVAVLELSMTLTQLMQQPAAGCLGRRKMNRKLDYDPVDSFCVLVAVSESIGDLLNPFSWHATASNRILLYLFFFLHNRT